MYQLGERPKKRTRLLKILALSLFLTILTIALIKFFNLEKTVFKGPKTVIQLVTDTGLKSDKGRVNVLFLGTGGQGHDGPDLSDTMILASIDKKTHDVALISIPRDLWAPDTKSKINAVYAFGQEKNGEGLSLVKKTVSVLFGIPIHYALRIDFDGFIKGVDLVDGLDVDVENAFTDPKYPIEGKEDDTCGLTIETKNTDGIIETIVKDATGSATIVTEENDPFTCRYETITFDMGKTYMDGLTALKFVRSRHGTNEEGNDFARSARQQKVILAFREKVLSTQTLLDPKTVINLMITFGQSIETDVNDEEIPLFIKLGTKVEPANIRRIVLDASNKDSVLEVGNSQDYNGQFVLIPKNNSWTDLDEYIQGEIFKQKEESTLDNSQ